MEIGLRIGVKEYQKIYNAGIRTGEIPFLNNLLNKWLEKYPHDFQSNIYRAEIDFENNNDRLAIDRIHSVLERDPEYLPGYELIALRSKQSDHSINSAKYVLTGKTNSINEIYPWATTLRAVKNEIKRNNINNANKLVKSALADEPSNILIALEHYKISYKLNNLASNTQLAKIYHQRWQNCLQFKIWLAISKMITGNESESVALLHSCAHYDPEGVVIRRLLGNNHEFLSIWPKERSIYYDQQIPTSIAVSLGWNRLNFW